MKKIIFLCFILISLIACSSSFEDKEKSLANPEPKVASFLEKREEVAERNMDFQYVTTITVGAIGDILIHDRVYDRAKVEEGKYDFSPSFQEVAELLHGPDFLMANMESMPGGVELGLSGFPAFNSPHEIVTALQDVGVHMLIGANNHTIDRGLRAVNSALDFYDKVGMDYVGVYRDWEDREQDRIVEIGDISWESLHTHMAQMVSLSLRDMSMWFH